VAGLVAREIEKAGIPTVAVSNSLEVTKRVAPPRAVAVRFPFGHATGEPGNRLQQRRVLLEALKLLAEADGPEIRPLPRLKWHRTDYAGLPPVDLPGVRAIR
jgi:D-proline reductase (dithiol) PrdB